MALFTDAPISTLDQLAAQDTAVLDVASNEGIDATAKISLAQVEVGVELTSAFSRSAFSRTSPSLWWPGSVAASLSVLQLPNVVVTPPLQLWHTFRSLALVYRDAYGNQLNDRYAAKWKEYEGLAKWASTMLFQNGIGLVSDPITVAGSPEVDLLSGPQAATMYFAQVAWLNAAGEEGMASPVASVSAPDQNSIQVSPTNPPPNAVTWNAYVGVSVDSITLQNPAPLGNHQTWLMPSTGLVQGRSPASGQEPNYYSQAPRFLQRG